MKTLIITILIFILSGPVFAWDDCTDKWNEDVRQAEKENYQNHMRAIQEELLMIEQQRELDRIRDRYERKDYDY
ncbi:hypothetical protein KAW18_01085 [candidate division WOR-3 bacterium]|nr:hypothetical protein [candidate division WOR-3 bacterium]